MRLSSAGAAQSGPTPDSTWVLQEVHGAEAQRSDPKHGDPSQYPHGHGPQGDVIRIYNLVRCVRDAGTGMEQAEGEASPSVTLQVSGPDPFPHRAWLVYSTDCSGRAELSVFDICGRRLLMLSAVRWKQ